MDTIIEPDRKHPPCYCYVCHAHYDYDDIPKHLHSMRKDGGA